METILKRQEIFDLISTELERAYKKHNANQWSWHEFYGILLEEVEEVWSEIKQGGTKEDIVKEIIQVAAVCIRHLEIGDRYES